MEDEEFRVSRRKDIEELAHDKYVNTCDKDVTSTHEDFDEDFSIGEPTNHRLKEDSAMGNILAS
jgi:hypothetical protein